MQMRFLKKTSAILTELLRMYPDENYIKVMLADIYIELEEDEKAIDLLNDVNKADPAYIQTLIQLADLYQAQGLFEVEIGRASCRERVWIWVVGVAVKERERRV